MVDDVDFGADGDSSSWDALDDPLASGEHEPGTPYEAEETPWAQELTDCCQRGASDAYGPLASEAEPLVWTQPDGTGIAVSGHDLNGDGRVDFVPLSIHRDDGAPDAWLVDPAGRGTANLLFHDLDGDGLPDAVRCDVDAAGAWTEPEPLPQSAGGSGTMFVGGDTQGLFSDPPATPGSIVVGPGTEGPFPDETGPPGTITIGGDELGLFPNTAEPQGDATLDIGDPSAFPPPTPDVNAMLDGLSQLGDGANDPQVQAALDALVRTLSDNESLADWSHGSPS
jgi:hypothetical protein